MATGNLDRKPDARIPPQTRVVMVLLAMVVLWATCGRSGPRYEPHGVASDARAVIAARLNPNIDPWWKLSALPNVGRDRARRIVEFRERHSSGRAFRTPADLLAIRGIGPATVRQAGPLLTFD